MSITYYRFDPANKDAVMANNDAALPKEICHISPAMWSIMSDVSSYGAPG